MLPPALNMTIRRRAFASFFRASLRRQTGMVIHFFRPAAAPQSVPVAGGGRGGRRGRRGGGTAGRRGGGEARAG